MPVGDGGQQLLVLHVGAREYVLVRGRAHSAYSSLGIGCSERVLAHALRMIGVLDLDIE